MFMTRNCRWFINRAGAPYKAGVLLARCVIRIDEVEGLEPRSRLVEPRVDGRDRFRRV